MSELINNREERQRVLKQIIKDIHAGRDPVELRERFKALLDQVGPEEVMALEQSLIDEGLPVEEITKLCDVHVSVFRDSLEQHATDGPPKAAHPIDVFAAETKGFSKRVGGARTVAEKIIAEPEGPDVAELLEQWKEHHAYLMKLDEHYDRKENLLFPYLERHGVSGPSSVMWSLHDEIRKSLKETSLLLMHVGDTVTKELTTAIADKVLPLYEQIAEMVFKEENILYPTCRDLFTEDEWATIAADVGVEVGAGTTAQPAAAPEDADTNEAIRFETGILTKDQIEGIFNHLPFDITFVDANDRVRYFSNGPERIFTRTKAVIGRDVHNCHPPGSVHVVERILDDFKSGRRDHADFWIQKPDVFILIRYFAVRSPEGEYMGTLEVTQNVKPIRELEGEKRILDDLPKD